MKTSKHNEAIKGFAIVFAIGATLVVAAGMALRLLIRVGVTHHWVG
jgi:hypothetical protein